MLERYVSPEEKLGTFIHHGRVRRGISRAELSGGSGVSEDIVRLLEGAILSSRYELDAHILPIVNHLRFEPASRETVIALAVEVICRRNKILQVRNTPTAVSDPYAPRPISIPSTPVFSSERPGPLPHRERLR